MDRPCLHELLQKWGVLLSTPPPYVWGGDVSRTGLPHGGWGMPVHGGVLFGEVHGLWCLHDPCCSKQARQLWCARRKIDIGRSTLQSQLRRDRSWAEARLKIARMTLTIKLDRNWSSFQLANSAPPLSVTGSAIAPSARMQIEEAQQTAV